MVLETCKKTGMSYTYHLFELTFSVNVLCWNFSWFRAKVLSCHNDNTYTVLFLDYGDNAHIHARDIAVLPTYLAHFPCQAVECKLYHVDYSSKSRSSDLGYP